MLPDPSDIVLISNRAGADLRDRVIAAYRPNLAGVDRDKFGNRNALVRTFPSGEIFVQLRDNVREERVHVVAGSHRPELYHLRRAIMESGIDQATKRDLVLDYLQSTEGELNELLKILDALRRASASRVTVHTSYLFDCRQDKKDEPRVPISARLIFDLIEAAGSPALQSVGVIDLHSQQEQGFTNYPVNQITLRAIFALYAKCHLDSWSDTILVCPDPNDYKAITKFAGKVGLQTTIIDKLREGDGKTEIGGVQGASVEGKNCLMMDDMIDSGGTIIDGAEILKRMGAKSIIACGTHGLFSPKFEGNKVVFAEDRFKEADVPVVTSNTIARTTQYREEHNDWLTVLDAGPLIADLIYCNETRGSHGKLLEEYIQMAIKGDCKDLERFVLN